MNKELLEVLTSQLGSITDFQLRKAVSVILSHDAKIEAIDGGIEEWIAYWKKDSFLSLSEEEKIKEIKDTCEFFESHFKQGSATVENEFLGSDAPFAKNIIGHLGEAKAVKELMLEYCRYIGALSIKPKDMQKVFFESFPPKISDDIKCLGGTRTRIDKELKLLTASEQDLPILENHQLIMTQITSDIMPFVKHAGNHVHIPPYLSYALGLESREVVENRDIYILSPQAEIPSDLMFRVLRKYNKSFKEWLLKDKNFQKKITSEFEKIQSVTRKSPKVNDLVECYSLSSKEKARFEEIKSKESAEKEELEELEQLENRVNLLNLRDSIIYESGVENIGELVKDCGEEGYGWDDKKIAQAAINKLLSNLNLISSNEIEKLPNQSSIDALSKEGGLFKRDAADYLIILLKSENIEEVAIGVEALWVLAEEMRSNSKCQTVVTINSLGGVEEFYEIKNKLTNMPNHAYKVDRIKHRYDIYSQDLGMQNYLSALQGIEFKEESQQSFAMLLNIGAPLEDIREYFEKTSIQDLYQELILLSEVLDILNSRPDASKIQESLDRCFIENIKNLGPLLNDSWVMEILSENKVVIEPDLQLELINLLKDEPDSEEKSKKVILFLENLLRIEGSTSDKNSILEGLELLTKDEDLIRRIKDNQSLQHLKNIDDYESLFDFPFESLSSLFGAKDAEEGTKSHEDFTILNALGLNFIELERINHLYKILYENPAYKDDFLDYLKKDKTNIVERYLIENIKNLKPLLNDLEVMKILSENEVVIEPELQLELINFLKDEPDSVEKSEKVMFFLEKIFRIKSFEPESKSIVENLLLLTKDEDLIKCIKDSWKISPLISISPGLILDVFRSNNLEDIKQSKGLSILGALGLKFSKEYDVNFAVKDNNLLLLKFLIEVSKLKADSKDYRNQRPIHKAIRNGNIEIFKYLLDAGSRTRSSFNPLSDYIVRPTRASLTVGGITAIGALPAAYFAVISPFILCGISQSDKEATLGYARNISKSIHSISAQVDPSMLDMVFSYGRADFLKALLERGVDIPHKPFVKSSEIRKVLDAGECAEGISKSIISTARKGDTVKDFPEVEDLLKLMETSIKVNLLTAYDFDAPTMKKDFELNDRDLSSVKSFKKFMGYEVKVGNLVEQYAVLLSEIVNTSDEEELKKLTSEFYAKLQEKGPLEALQPKISPSNMAEDREEFKSDDILEEGEQEEAVSGIVQPVESSKLDYLQRDSSR